MMNIIWSFGGKLLDADNKTVALHSTGTVAAIQFIADMYTKHKIVPKGSLAWDNAGNNKAYQSRQVIFVVNASSIYAHLAESDKELYNVTGMFPLPAGPGGAFDSLTTAELLLFNHNPYPEVARGRAAYWMAPENLRVTIEEGDGRWGPPYKGMYESDFWKRPAFQHWRGIVDRGRQFAHAGVMNAASGEVMATNVVARIIHRVLIEHWEAEKAVEEAHKKAAEIYARHQQES
jgi:multiple sugar transport system substrate-binding protein